MDIEEIKKATLEQVEKRSAEIEKMLKEQDIEADKLDELTNEANALVERKKAIAQEKENVQKRNKLLDMVASNKVPTTNKPTPIETRSSVEYRKAFMNYVTKGTSSDVLQYAERAGEAGVASDLGVLLPETIIQQVITDLKGTYGQLYARVKKTNIPGGVKYPIGVFEATFHRITETTVSDRQPAKGVTGYIQFSYNIGEIRISRTFLQSLLTVEAFETEVAKAIVRAYVQAMDYEIIHGSADSNQCEGILTEANKTSGSRISADHIIEFTADEISDWTAWEKKLFAIIPMAMEKENPEFVMAKQTYVSNLCTMKDSTGQPINKAGFDASDKLHKFNEYEVNRVEKDIFGDFDSASTGDYFGMFWCPEKAYAINSNLQFTMQHYFDHETNQYVDKALVVNDGKPLDTNYIYLFKKKVA